MHHSLIPPHERSYLNREYAVRAAIVSCFLLSIAGIIGVVSLFPAYIHARGEQRTMLDSVASMKANADDPATAARAALASDASLISAAGASFSSPRLSQAIAVVAAARGDVSISSLAAQGQASPPSVLIVIKGSAPTRDDLLAFQSRLEALAPGAKVDLPISELAVSADIPFSLHVTLPLP